jgi:anti-anti-sigma regulatory factor
MSSCFDQHGLWHFSLNSCIKGAFMDSEIIELEGELSILRVIEIKDRLLTAANGREMVLLDLSKISAADISGLQLLCALHKRQALLAKKVGIHGELSESLRQTVTAAGFSRDSGCHRGIDPFCFWISKREK